MNEHPPRGRTAKLPLYLSSAHPCSYLEGFSARTLFADPQAAMDGPLYERLLGVGFRRSGYLVYRPTCEACMRCVPVRIPIERFAPNRSQRRNTQRNADLTLAVLPAVFDQQHYAVYERYLRDRHPDGSMAEDVTPQGYSDFLIRPWGGETLLLELRLGEQLVGVAVTDRLPGALSAVYTYFDPALSGRALGTYALLCQIEQARHLGLRYLYLGYWIEECRKMTYKDNFRPIQAFLAGCWREYARGEHIDWQGASSPTDGIMQSQ